MAFGRWRLELHWLFILRCRMSVLHFPLPWDSWLVEEFLAGDDVFRG